MQIASLEAELNQRASPQALSSKDKQISFLESEISQLKSTLDEVTRTQGDSDLDQSKMLQLEADVEKQSSTIKMLEHQVCLRRTCCCSGKCGMGVLDPGTLTREANSSAG